MNISKQVYKKLINVPKGKVTTYSELAKAVGLKNGQRAIGQIMKKKSISSNNSMSSCSKIRW